ncbi:hypothetical protein GCM10023085_75730 [Actinomadura viridis]|uniref:Uncharacterized protein n=1 Tax=Actinomadura viridis TaxID=58110 RepID=A0A931DCW6_9ACTN|nr:hypothetical protein [Actinomadura viridis]MBG6086544.1 hypothetical protein [Actinomadura viridis]
MTEPTPYERRWLDVLDELRHCSDPDLQMTWDHQGPLTVEPADAHSAFGTLAQQDGVLLDPALQKCFLRFDGLGACWGYGEEETDPLFAGEFSLSPLAQAIRRQPPVERYPDPSPEQLELLVELRDFDGTPMGGVGSISSLRIKQGGVHNPEIWFSDGELGVHRMDIDLCGYLDALRVTKGAYGWQYLFTDVSLTEEDHEVTAEFLTEMLAVFPDLFPAHDYEPLRARLAERLR